MAATAAAPPPTSINATAAPADSHARLRPSLPRSCPPIALGTGHRICLGSFLPPVDVKAASRAQAGNTTDESKIKRLCYRAAAAAPEPPPRSRLRKGGLTPRKI